MNSHSTNCFVRTAALLQRQVAGADVGVEGEFAWAGLLRSGKTAVFFMERRGRNVAGPNGGFDARIVVGIADADDEIAGVKFDVLTAGDVSMVTSPAVMRA